MPRKNIFFFIKTPKNNTSHKLFLQKDQRQEIAGEMIDGEENALVDAKKRGSDVATATAEKDIWKTLRGKLRLEAQIFFGGSLWIWFDTRGYYSLGVLKKSRTYGNMVVCIFLRCFVLSHLKLSNYIIFVNNNKKIGIQIVSLLNQREKKCMYHKKKKKKRLFYKL